MNRALQIIATQKLTGTLRSPAFTLPSTLTFYLCGHDGFPGKPVSKTNFVRLRDAHGGVRAAFNQSYAALVD